MSYLILVRTAFDIGIRSIYRYILYKLSIKFGTNPVLRMGADIPTGIFFQPPNDLELNHLDSNLAWMNQNTYFGWFTLNHAEVPQWHLNPFMNKIISSVQFDWWKLPDFASDHVDIKVVWEVSRFDWVIGFAQQTILGKNENLPKLNIWIADWILNNPPYKGENWKCGQEASIRIIHLAVAALILNQSTKTTPALLNLVHLHLQRIAPTLSYAIAQNNNHGTSEAAALYIGGSWLQKNGNKDGKDWCKLGEKWLEKCVLSLIENDGSFSQYSINYHRLMLDTLSIVEIWRLKLNLSKFSTNFYEKLAKATLWIYHFIQSENGFVPNLGANDGANLLPLTSADYRDFRPSTQLASALFLKKIAFESEGPMNDQLNWLKIEIPTELLTPKTSIQFDQGGYNLLINKQAFVLLRYARFKFRPGQADVLHVDFWHRGENLLRDGGSYSYNASQHDYYYFSGVSSHNTIQFDGNEQMPRIGRFLFGDWLKTNDVDFLLDDKWQCNASYRTRQGVSHSREVVLEPNRLIVTDNVSGFKEKAVLRWRLKPSDWVLEGNKVTNGIHCIEISADIPIIRMELTIGEESLYYLQKTKIPVIEIEFNQAGQIHTEYFF